MRLKTGALLGLLLCIWPLSGMALEGTPLLSVDDLLTIQESYEGFLDRLEELIVARGLLEPQERDAWRDAQMGDFFQNGGYGSVLVNYMPGVLGYVREEETYLQLTANWADGRSFHLDTVRRYTPQDSSLSGLMLTMTLTDTQGIPEEAQFFLHADGGLFMKWDALQSAYVSVGDTAQSDGETVVWTNQTPVQGAKDPAIYVDVRIDEEENPRTVVLQLTVDDWSYRVADDALMIRASE